MVKMTGRMSPRTRRQLGAASMASLVSASVWPPSATATADEGTATTAPPTTAPATEDVDFARLLQAYRPGMQWSLNGDSWLNSPGGGCCDQLTIHDGSPKPTRDELLAFLRANGPSATAPRPVVSVVPEALSLDYSKILARRFPGMQWSLNGDGCCDQLTIHDGSRKPTKSELDAMWADVEREILAEMREGAKGPGAPSDDTSPAATALSGGMARPVVAGSAVPTRAGVADVATIVERRAGPAGFMVSGEGASAELVVDVRGLRGKLTVRAVRGNQTIIWRVSGLRGTRRTVARVDLLDGFMVSLVAGGRTVERIAVGDR